MYHQIKTNIQLFLVLGLTAVTLVVLSTVIGTNMQPITAAAQAPADLTPSPVVLDLQTETVFRQALSDQPLISGVSYNLLVTKTVDKAIVTSGEQVTFTISIKNQDSQPAVGILFQDDFPAEMSNITYDFSVSNVISDTKTKPSWLFLDPIGINQTVVVTVTGKLVSSSSVTVNNVAKVWAFTSSDQIKTDAASVSISSSGVSSILYLPYVERQPTPTPTPTPQVVIVYFQNFTSGTWYEFDNNGCQTDHRDGQYLVYVDPSNRDCLPPAKNERAPDQSPYEKPYRTYGEFGFFAYHSEGQSNASYGLFINGEGGDNYYLFRIWPNNGCSSGGGWELLRRRNGNLNTLISKSCDTAIHRGYGVSNLNILRIAHQTDRTLKVYANGILLGSYQDDVTNHLTGTTTGVYAHSNDRRILIRFDDFTVYKYP